MTLKNDVCRLENTFLKINQGKLFLKLMLEQQKSKSGSIDFSNLNVDLLLSKLDSDLIQIDSSNGLLFVDVPGHGKVYFNDLKDTAGHKALNKLLSYNKSTCFTSYYPGVDCSDYFYKCIVENNPDKKNCLDMMLREDYEPYLEEIVKKGMHPTIAHNILKSLGFHKDIDSDGNETVQSLEDWYKKVNLSKNDKNNINTVFLRYIEIVRAIVNNIKKKDITSQSSSQTNNKNNIGTKVKRKTIINFNTSLSSMKNQIKDMAINHKNFGKELLLPFILNGGDLTHIPLVVEDGNVKMMYSNQTGGNNINIDDYNKKCGTDLLKSLYRGIVEDLKANGKTLSNNSRSKIKKNLKQMKALEDKVYESIDNLYIGKLLVDSFKGFPHELDNNFDENKLKIFIKKHESLVNKYNKGENYLFSIIKDLSRILNKLKNTSSKSRTTIPM
jgi:hypothetical protein